MDNWKNHIRACRKFMRGWDLNVKAANRKKKQVLIDRIEYIDKETEMGFGSFDLFEERSRVEQELKKIYIQEEIFWKQRATETKIKEGDKDTKYFQRLANGKRRKKHITSLLTDEGWVKEVPDLIKHASEFYKYLFGYQGRNKNQNTMGIGESLWGDPDKISEEDRTVLSADFTEQEVWEVVKEMDANKAPGPDGFSMGFYKKFWEVIKGDLMNMFREFHNNKLNISRINYAVICLLPNVQMQSELSNTDRLVC